MPASGVEAGGRLRSDLPAPEVKGRRQGGLRRCLGARGRGPLYTAVRTRLHITSPASSFTHIFHSGWAQNFGAKSFSISPPAITACIRAPAGPLRRVPSPSKASEL